MSNKRIDQYPNNDPTLGGDNLFLMYASGHTVNATLTSVKDYVLSAYTVTSSDVVDALGYTPLSAYTDTYVTGGTYTSGEITLKRNDGNLVLIKGLPIGGSGGQLYYFNISNTQTPYKEFSTKATDILEQSTTVSVSNGTTSTIQSFLTPNGYPNTPLIPGGVWNFYLHSYKEDVSSSFEIYCDVYKRTTGGTETLLFSTNPVDVDGVSPDEVMILTNGYYSGSSLSVKDRVLIKVQAKNNGPLTKTITLLSEGVEHYSYGVTPFNDTNALTCSNIGDCGTIQLIQSDLDKKLNKSGDTMTGSLIVPTIYVNTISAATYQNLPLDLYVTGGTYSNNTFTFNNSNGDAFGVTFNEVTGLTVNGNLTVTGDTNLNSINVDTINTNTISASTYLNLPLDVYVTGGTFDDSTKTLTLKRNDLYDITVTGFKDYYVTGGTFDDSTKTLTLKRNGLSDILITGFKDYYVTGATYSNNTFTFNNSNGGIFGVTFNTVTGLTVNGNLTVTGTTNLNSINVNTISASTYQNLPTDIRVTGGTYSNGTATFRNNIGGSFNVTGFYTGATDIFTTGATYSNNNFTFTNNTGGTFGVSFNSVTGLTVNGNLNVTGNTTVSALTGSSATINGLTKTVNLQITSGATAGYVLRSLDSLGNAQWGAETSVVVTGITFWSTAKTYAANSIVLAKYENEWRLWLALTGFTSSGVSFPGGQTIATDLNSYTGQWQEISPFRGTSTSVVFGGSMTYSASLTPPTINLSNNAFLNNYNPTGLTNTNFLRLDTVNNVNISGLQAPSPVKNQGIYIVNINTGNVTITLKNEDTNSLPGNRFLLGGDKNMQPNEGIMLIYDDISLRWRSQAIQI